VISKVPGQLAESPASYKIGSKARGYPYAKIEYVRVLTYLSNKNPQLWLRNPRDATSFQIHPEEVHRN